MREIKFRAYDLEVKEMSFDFLNDKWLEVCIKSPYVKLMQYTGLKDKNGVEIYEGDILKVPDLYETPENTSIMYHYEKVYFGKCSFFVGDELIEGDYEYIESYCEVIGNIYENKGLLEDK